MAFEGLRGWQPGHPRVEHRNFLATPKVVAQLEAGFWALLPGEPRHRMVARRWELYSLVLRWLDGNVILAGEELKPLQPWDSGIWEFRTVHAAPGSRLLGVIPEVNVFVALGLYRRDHLGAGGSKEWQNACGEAREECDAIFGRRAPLCFPGSAFGDPEAKAFWNDK